jgi:hypothetical protein
MHGNCRVWKVLIGSPGSRKQGLGVETGGPAASQKCAGCENDYVDAQTDCSSVSAASFAKSAFDGARPALAFDVASSASPESMHPTLFVPCCWG